MDDTGPDFGDRERREIDLAAIEACRSGPWPTAAEWAAGIEAGRVHNARVRARGEATAPRGRAAQVEHTGALMGGMGR